MSNLTPPPRLRADALDSEIFDMVRASERGLVRFPPPPAPVDRDTLARIEPGALAKRTKPAAPVDIMRIVTRILICIALAIPVWAAWVFWRSLFE